MTKLMTKDYLQERYMQGDMPDDYIYWARVNESLNIFEKKATMRSFKKLFEDYQVAEKLWGHFVMDCDYKVLKFLTYLNQDQKNVLIVNAHENKTFLYT